MRLPKARPPEAIPTGAGHEAHAGWCGPRCANAASIAARLPFGGARLFVCSAAPKAAGGHLWRVSEIMGGPVAHPRGARHCYPTAKFIASGIWASPGAALGRANS